MLNSKLQSSNVLCSKVPTSVSSNVVFVVDVNKLDDPNDLLCDDMGVWRNQISTIKKNFSSDEAAYTLKRVYRVHGTNAGLKKLTVYIYGMSSCTVYGEKCYVMVINSQWYLASHKAFVL